MLNNDVVRGIEKIISGYEYGQYSLLDNNLTVKYDLENGKVSIDPFYNHNTLTNKDTCAGLMSKAYFDLRLTFRNLFVTRVAGNDPDFFTDSNYSNHCFLLVSDSDIMNYCSYVEYSDGIEYAASKNPLLVDPSFKKILPFSESKYVLQRLMNHDYSIDWKNSQTLQSENNRKNCYPLIMSDDGLMLFLNADFDSKHYLGITISKKDDSKNLIYPLESDSLDGRFKNEPRVYQFIEHLRNAKKINARNTLTFG